MILSDETLRGSFTPLVTPFHHGDIDFDAYRRLITLQIKGGSSGVVVAGTSGEPSTLSAAERAELLECAINAADGRLAIVAATGSQSHAETVWLTEHATRAGADALLVVTPYYIKPSQAGLIEYFADICSRTDLPVILYHIPGRAAVSVSVESLAAMHDRSPNLVGVKHAVNDIGFVSDVLDRMGKDFRVFVGLEELSFPMLALGAAGLMNAVGNVAPARLVNLCSAVDAEDLKAGRRLHYELLELNRAVFFDTNPVPIKYMLRRLGHLSTNEHRLPMVPADRNLEQRLDAVLRGAGML